MAQSIAALAGADVTPEPFQPVARGMLLTDGRPKYLTARIAGGQGFSSEIAGFAQLVAAGKIAAVHLAPYLDALEKEREAARPSAAGTRAPRRPPRPHAEHSAALHDVRARVRGELHQREVRGRRRQFLEGAPRSANTSTRKRDRHEREHAPITQVAIRRRAPSDLDQPPSCACRKASAASRSCGQYTKPWPSLGMSTSADTPLAPNASASGC